MSKGSKSKKTAIEAFLDQIKICKDFRDPDKVEYSLEEIIFLVFCASLCDCQTYNEISDFGELRIEWLRQHLPYKNGIPSHDTVNRVLGLIEPKQLEQVLVNWSMYEMVLPQGSVISIDGKWLNKSATAQEQQTKVSEGGKQVKGMLNVYCSELSSCIASIGIGGRSSERKGADRALDMLELSGCILTLDAGFCHHKTIDKIVKEKHADYVIGLKNNQKNLSKLGKKLFEQIETDHPEYRQLEKDHGRIESRTCRVIDIVSLPDLKKEDREILNKWEGLKSIIEVDSKREVLRTGKVSGQKRYYISSLNLTAQKASALVRSHWKIENNLHWVLDVIMREDSSGKQSKNAAVNYSIFLKMALNHLKKVEDKGVSIKRKIKKCSGSLEYLEKTIYS